MTVRITALLVVLALVGASCTSSADTQTETSDGAATTGETTTDGGGTDGGTVAESLDPDEIPPLPVLVPDGIVEPGGSVLITADPRLEGEVRLLGSGDRAVTAPMTGGSANLSVPADLVPGRYVLALGDDLAIGVLIVMHAPGVLVSGPSYWAPDAEPTVEVIVHGLGDGQIAALELTDANDTVERLAPHALLELAPVTPTSAGFAEGRHTVSLPAGFLGTVRAMAGNVAEVADPYAEEVPEVVSDDLRIRRCDEPSGIIGDLGAPGVITAIGAASGEPVRMVSDSGRFLFDLLPGPAVVSAILMDGTSPAMSPQVVRVSCGSHVDVGDLTEAVDLGPVAGDYLGGLTGDDLWAYTATATGDLAFEHEGSAECWGLDEVDVDFNSSGFETLFYRLTLQPPLETGVVEGMFHIEDFLSGESADGVLTGEIEVGIIDESHAMGGAFSGTVEGTMGTIEIELRFVCSGYFLEAAGEFDEGGNVLLSAPVPQTRHHRLRASSGSDSRCKLLYIGAAGGEFAGATASLGGHWASGLMDGLSRMAIWTSDDIANLLWLENARLLLGTETDGSAAMAAMAGALNADFQLSFKVNEAAESGGAQVVAKAIDTESSSVVAVRSFSGETSDAALESAIDGWQEFVEPLANAGICVELTPTSVVMGVEETKEFTLEVTNLAGEPAESAEVEVSEIPCGTWDPDSGTMDGTAWSTKFTAGDTTCEDRASFKITADGTQKELKESLTADVEVRGLWEFEITITLDTDRANVVATSTGELFIEDDFGFLIGAGTGTVEGTGTARCEVNGSVTYQDVDLAGEYKVMISGTTKEETAAQAIPSTLIPGGFDVHTVGTYKQSSPCMEAGTYRDEFFSLTSAEVLVVFPHILANRPEGFEVPLFLDEREFSMTEALSGLPGATITIRVWLPMK